VGSAGTRPDLARVVDPFSAGGSGFRFYRTQVSVTKPLTLRCGHIRQG